MTAPAKTTNPAGYEAPFGVTADPVVYTVEDGELKVLLHRRSEEPFTGEWALPGGFVGRRESSRDTVVRKLQEKTGMPPIYVEQLQTYDEPYRDVRGWVPSVAYLALVPATLLPEQTDTDAAWHSVRSLPRLPFDHGTMVADGLERLRGKLWYSNVAVGLLPPRFAMREALNVYAAISDRSFPRLDNFARDLLHTGLVRGTGARGEAPRGGPRPELFEFISAEPSWAPGYAKGTASAPKRNRRG
jgi:8-oxo-dGTP diphosphatase